MRRQWLQWFVRLLPALLIAGGALYALVTPRQFTAAPLFVAAPLAAAPFASFAGTLVTGLAATMAVTVLHVHDSTLTEAQAYTEEFTLLTVSVLALLINGLIRRGGERLASARQIAEAAQQAVLPAPPRELGGLLIAARYVPAVADALIGGDFFAVQDTSYGVRLVVGDVRGKGLGAVGMVAVAVGTFREAAERESSLESVADWLDGALAREAERRYDQDGDESFATAVLAEIPHHGSVVRLVSRGHPGPLLLRAGATPRLLLPARPALPLGMTGLVGTPARTEEYPLPRGSTVLLYTDGLTEARDRRGVFYDPVIGLAGRPFTTPGALLETVIGDVQRHTNGNVTDDMALLALTPVGVPRS
ncbi:PP2C family protein-serine/threonine phosphatase [Streptomyces sp. NPDC004838]